MSLKCPIPTGESGPPSTGHGSFGARESAPFTNDSSIGSSVFAGLTVMINTQIHRKITERQAMRTNIISCIYNTACGDAG